MRRAMAQAEVGDDVYGEDPTVARLEEHVAGLLGHEAALFTPTGSMANVLAVRSVVGVGQEVLCESRAHIARAELGAHGAYTGLTMRTWIHPRGQVDLAVIRSLFAPDMGPFFVPTAAISVENTHNFAGGAVLPLADLRDLREFATGAGAGIHLDGARIWNAHVATGTPFEEYGAIADVLSVCLSKGLGAPVGSVLVGSSDAVAETRGCWPRPVGSTRTAWTPTSSSSTALMQRRSSRRRAPRAWRSRPSGRPPYAWSRTSTSRATTPRRRPQLSRASRFVS